MKKQAKKEALIEESFYNELKILVNKYNLKNAVFAADSDGQFWGNCIIEKYKESWKYTDLALCLVTASRMFQSLREKILLIKI
jgi:hypothetical protein